MNGFVLMIPFLFIRFGLLFIVNKDAVKRAAHFPRMFGNEVYAYWIYQISNVFLFIYICFLKVIIDSSIVFYSGVVFYLSGLILCAISIICFGIPSKNGFHCNGIYRLSRNPMYVSYFVCFIGCSLLTQSIILCGTVVLFQLSSHWIVLSEERWCLREFGTTYKQYTETVRRYI